MNSIKTFFDDDSNIDHDVYNAFVELKNKFNITVCTQGYPVTYQNGVSTCWVHASTNLCRLVSLETIGTKSLEFSQEYILYHHFLGRIEYFFNYVNSLSNTCMLSFIWMELLLQLFR